MTKHSTAARRDDTPIICINSGYWNDNAESIHVVRGGINSDT